MIPVADTIPPWSPYLVETFPISSGRVLLGELLATYTGLQYGIGAPHIAEAFAPDGDASDRKHILAAVRFLGGLFQSGRFTAYARAIGGGEPVRMDAGMWELDDFTARFATCALDLRRPFDASANPTHRIFMEVEDLDALIESCCADVVPYPAPKGSRRKPASPDPVDGGGSVAVVGDPGLDRRIRMPELEMLVGKKKSAIYDAVKRGEFPEGELDGSRIRFWRASEVAAFLAGRD